MMDKYKDIINLPHHVSQNHKPMDKINRAAQFAPFAALVGYEEAIKEKGRTVDKKIILTNEEKEKISNILSYINLNIKNEIKVSITYFIKDKKKSGGKYITITSNIKSVDLINRFIKLVSNQKILIDDIYDLKSELFININN